MTLGPDRGTDLSDLPTTPIGPPVGVIGRGRPDRPALGWTELGIAAGTYVVIQLLLGILVLAVNGGELPGAPGLVTLSALSAFLAVGAAVAARVRSAAALGLRRVSGRVVALAVALGLGVWVLSRIVVVVYVVVTGDRSNPQESLLAFRGGVAAAVVIVVGGLLVPFGEELLFRGVGYGALRRYGALAATAATGLLFALAHGLNVVFAAALLLGVLNAVLYERTRSVWPCVAAHATFNLLSFGLLLLLR